MDDLNLKEQVKEMERKSLEEIERLKRECMEKVKEVKDKCREETTAIAKELRDGGKTLAEVASVVGKSISWVSGRVEMGGESIEELRNQLERLREKKEAIMKGRVERQVKRMEEGREEVNSPQDRSYEELIEYRKRRDEFVQNP